MTTYLSNEITFQGFQFDGTHAQGLEIQKYFANEPVDLVYEYFEHYPQYKLKILIGKVFHWIHKTDYIVRGPRDHVFILPKLVFEDMLPGSLTDVSQAV